MTEKWDKAFIFADMDAFFASIEQMDDPALRGKPVGVTNGMTGTCIITCSYEARIRGVKSVDHLKNARKICPELIRKPARPERYVQISTRVIHSLEKFTNELEIFSVDEVFLDVTKSQHLFGDPVTIAKRVKEEIYRVSGVKASIGVADSKLVAKWAAKREKPDGFVVVEPGTAQERLAKAPVTQICGINKGIGNYLAQHNAFTCGDVAKLPMSVLSRRFGNIGKRLHLICCGSDPEPVITRVADPKTIGHGKIIPPNTMDRNVIEMYLLHMSFKLAVRLRLYGYQSGYYSMGLNTQDGWCGGKDRISPTAHMMDIYNLCLKIMAERWDGSGVSQVQVTALTLEKGGQLDLFQIANPAEQAINNAVDGINTRFGELAIAPATLLNRSEMPNVISPSWKPFGHRETILSGKYARKKKPSRNIPFRGYIS